MADADANEAPETGGMRLMRDVLEGRMPRPAAGDLLGWEMLDMQPGRVRVSFKAHEGFYNPAGVVQGGLLAAMLDDAMGPAAVTTLAEGEFATTLEIKVSFLRSATTGTFVADARVVHRGKSIIFLEGTLSNDAGEPVATATATARIVPFAGRRVEIDAGA